MMQSEPQLPGSADVVCANTAHMTASAASALVAAHAGRRSYRGTKTEDTSG